MIRKIISWIPEALRRKIKRTPLGDLWNLYTHSIESRINYISAPLSYRLSSIVKTDLDIPLGNLQFYVLERTGHYRNPETWPSTEPYPEPLTVNEFCNIFDNDTVLYNIGAGYGYYHAIGLMAGIPSEQIVNFEGDRVKCQILKKSDPEANVVNAYVSDHMNPRQGLPDIINLDDWFSKSQPPPTIIKIDIDGTEFDALRGMEKLLMDHRPILYVELHPGRYDDIEKELNQIYCQLSELDYNLHTANHRSARTDWAPPKPDDYIEKSENGVDFFLKATPY